MKGHIELDFAAFLHGTWSSMMAQGLPKSGLPKQCSEQNNNCKKYFNRLLLGQGGLDWKQVDLKRIKFSMS